MPEAKKPPHIGSGRKQRKRLVRSDEEAVTNFRARLRGKIVGLIVKVCVRPWAN